MKTHINHRNQHLRQARFLLLACIFYLFSCSATQQAYIQNFKLLLASDESITFSNERINASSIDLAYVKYADRPSIVVALAFIENEKYKWVSSNDVVLETMHGRITRVSGAEQNLIHVSNIGADPLKFGPDIGTNGAVYSRRIDTSIDGVDAYGAELRSEFKVGEQAEITINDIPYSVVELIESVTYFSALQDELTWVNRFYFDQESKRLLKSMQTIAPNMNSVEISYVSRALRIKSATAGESQHP